MTLDALTDWAWPVAALTQVTLMLGAGLLAARTLRRRPARAHAALVLAAAAAIAAPLGTLAARRADVGLFPAAATAPSDTIEAGREAAPAMTQTLPRAAPVASGTDRAPDPSVSAAPGADATNGHGARAWSVGWSGLGAGAWALLSAVMLVRTVAAAWRARRLVSDASVPVPPYIQTAASAAASELELACEPDVRASTSVTSPVVWCWGRRPVVVVPGCVHRGVDWRSVLRHELAHWSRRDHLADALLRTLVVLVPFHPFAWAAHRRLERLAERACDDWAVAPGDAPAYAQSLVTLAARTSGPRLALPAAREGSDLSARVRRVLDLRGALPRAGRGWLVAGVITATALTALTALARQPAAQPPARAPGVVGAPDTPLEHAVKDLYDTLAADGTGAVFGLAGRIADRNDPAAIPLLIGVIDSDNTYWSVYGVGYFGLAKLTGVQYDDRYDGTWWKAWWQKNKHQFPPEAQRTPIPEFPPTKKRIARVYDHAEWAGLTKGEPPERILQEIERRLGAAGAALSVSNLSERLVSEHGPRAIPWLIGVIDSDNSYETIYGTGHFGLSKITGVTYDDRRDGPWWRAWWEKNKARFPMDARETPIPTLKKSPRHVPSVYDHGRWIGEVDTEPLARMMTELKRRMEAGEGVSSMAQLIAARGDPSVIPEMIALIKADKSGDAMYDIGHFGLAPLTKVKYDDAHDGAWWERWWEQNKARFAGGANAGLPNLDLKNPPPAPVPEDIADVPQQEVRIGGDEHKRYFLIGAGPDAPAAPLGLLVILPGGDASADFNPFIRRIWKNALPKGFVVAQAVAPRWRDDEDRVVWPTERLPDANMAFAAEHFIEAIIADVAARVKIDPAKVFALGWSSGGPPVYAAAMRPDSSLRGAFVAMSVYKPEQLPPATGLAGKSFYILHSPEDFIKMNFPRTAVEQLGAGGARVKLTEYAGGHGWRGNVWKNIRDGVEWLVAKDEAPKKP